MSASDLGAAFDEQARRTPDAIAVVHGELRWRYRELQQQADRIASGLLGRGIASQEPVGVLAGRSAAMVAAVLGVIKAGGCYVPLDPGLPAERRSFIARDAGLRHVLYDEQASDDGLPGLALLSIAGLEADAAHVPPAVMPQQLAYIMYTSGSTGRPKGVMVPHGAVLNLARDNDFVPLGPGDRLLLTGAIGFDQTTFELWGALLNGLALHLVDTPTLLDADRLGPMLARDGITTLLLTSALFSRLAAQAPATFAPLHTLMVGGDVLHPQHVRAVRRACPGLALLNVYGPTENTTFSTTHRVVDDTALNVPIGRPLRGTFAHVVDAQGRPVEDGRTGELVVGGANLAQGYLNLPQLTQERFIELPGLGRVYRTGDLARRTGDGAFVYLGRQDRQIKLGGYRVELAEVESAIAGIPGVQASAVKAWEHQGERFLAAYYAGGGDAPGPQRLRERLAQRLPGYMVPTFCFRHEVLPIDARGKLDMEALEDPFSVAPPAPDAPAPAPADTTLPQRMLRAWSQALQVPDVGFDDDFHALGGNSIKAVQLMGLLSADGIDVSLSDILHHRTAGALLRQLQAPLPAAPAHVERAAQAAPPRELSPQETDAMVARVAHDHRANTRRLELGALQCRFPMSPIQQLQIRFDTPASVGHLMIEGRLDAQALARAFAALACEQTLMHSLSVRAGDDGDEWEEREGAQGLALSFVDLSAFQFDPAGLSALLARLVGGLRFQRSGLPYHVTVLSLNLHEHLVLLAFHHVLFDRVSDELIRRELRSRYHAELEGRRLPATQGPSFHDYVQCLRQGPLDLDEAALVERFGLHDFFEAKRRLLGSSLLRRMDESHTFEIAVPWPGHLQQGRSLGGALALYVKAVAAVFDAGTLPLLFVHEGRSYGGRSYHHVLGEFIDYVPLVLDAGLDAAAMQRHAGQRMADLDRHRVNFLQLALDREAAAGWPRVAALVDPGESLSRIDVCMFNYLGNTPLPGSVHDHAGETVRITPNPLPLHSFLNCIVVSHADGLVFQFRSSIDPKVAALRRAFAALAVEVTGARGDGGTSG